MTTDILTAFYKAAAREVPSWINLLSAETQLEDIVELQKQIIRGFLIKLVNDTHARHFHSLTDSVGKECQRNVQFESRLIYCPDKGLIPFLRRKKGTANKAEAYTGEVIILHDIVTELRRQRIDYISSLPQLQSMIGGG